MNNQKFRQNIKGLAQDFTEELDMRMHLLRKGTSLENVRKSDAKTFMLISRKPRSISELAKAMQISRQAAHMSVGRLIELGAVMIDETQTNNRDKVPIITNKGQKIRQGVISDIEQLEDQLVQKIGRKKLEQLRGILLELLA